MNRCLPWVLTGVLVSALGGCYNSDYDVWPRHSGDAIPISTTLECVSFNNGVPKKESDITLGTVNRTNEYALLDIAGKDTKMHLTFHRLRKDDTVYVVAGPLTDEHGKEAGENLLLARIPDDGSWLTTLEVPQSDAQDIAKDVKLDSVPIFSMSGTVEQQRKFLDEASRLKDLTTLMFCTPKS